MLTKNFCFNLKYKSKNTKTYHNVYILYEKTNVIICSAYIIHQNKQALSYTVRSRFLTVNDYP